MPSIPRARPRGTSQESEARRKLPVIELVFKDVPCDIYSEQRRRVAAILAREPNLSHRALAKKAKVPVTTVRSIRKRLAAGRAL